MGHRVYAIGNMYGGHCAVTGTCRNALSQRAAPGQEKVFHWEHCPAAVAAVSANMALGAAGETCDTPSGGRVVAADTKHH